MQYKKMFCSLIIYGNEVGTREPILTFIQTKKHGKKAMYYLIVMKRKVKKILPINIPRPSFHTKILSQINIFLNTFL